MNDSGNAVAATVAIGNSLIERDFSFQDAMRTRRHPKASVGRLIPSVASTRDYALNARGTKELWMSSLHERSARGRAWELTQAPRPLGPLQYLLVVGLGEVSVLGGAIQAPKSASFY